MGCFLLIYFLFGLVQLKARVKVGGVVILGGFLFMHLSIC